MKFVLKWLCRVIVLPVALTLFLFGSVVWVLVSIPRWAKGEKTMVFGTVCDIFTDFFD